MRVAADGEVRQRRPVPSEDLSPPPTHNVSTRKFWIITGCFTCGTSCCLLAIVLLFLYLSVPEDFTILKYYQIAAIMGGGVMEFRKELGRHPRLPFPPVDDPIFNRIDETGDGDDFYRMFSVGKENGTGCERLKGIQRKFCRASIGAGAVKNWKKYEALRERCRWKSEDAFRTYPTFTYADFPELKRDSGYTHFTHDETQRLIDKHRKRDESNRVQIKSCEVLEDRDWEWKIVRLGPFFSTGGYDWHRYYIPNSTEQGDRLYSAFFYGPVDRNGKVLPYPPIHIHHMHSATTQCSMIARMWSGGIPHPPHGGRRGLNWYFDVHGDRQCKAEQGGTACLHKEFPEGYAQYTYLPQCIFGEVNDVRPANSSKMEFWVEHAYRIGRDCSIARPIGFFASGAGPHVHVEETFSAAKAVKSALGGKASYEPSLVPVDDYDAPTNEDSLIWCTIRFPYAIKILSVWVHTHHQFTHDQFLFRGHPRELGLDTGPLTLENHYTPLLLSKTGIDRHQLKNYLFNNMLKNGGSVACKLNEDRFEKGTPGVLPKGVPNDIYDRIVMPNCSSNLSFSSKELVTIVALHGSVTGKKTGNNTAVMHSAFYSEFVRPECHNLLADDDRCAKHFVDDLHLPCLESMASPKAISLLLAQRGLQNTKDNLMKAREELARFAAQGGGLW